MNGENTRPPARTPAAPIPVAYDRASSEVDGVNIIAAQPLPRLWLRVAFAIAPDTDPARIALAAAVFVGRVCAIDKRLKLSVDQQRCSATADELVLTFALGRWGALEAEWAEEAKPAVTEATAAFEGTAVKNVEVVKEHRT